LQHNSKQSDPGGRRSAQRTPLAHSAGERQRRTA
jgi:hypothetical protein